MYADYRNLAKPLAIGANIQEPTGVPYRQWLGTALQAMGVPRSEYEREGEFGGYGDPYMEGDEYYPFPMQIVPQVNSLAGEVLPFLQA